MACRVNGSVRRQLTPLEPLVRAIESAGVLDAVGKPVAKAVRNAVPKGTVKNALSGTWLGHALHPPLTDVVIGSFTSAMLIDLLGGKELAPASERLIAAGIAAAVPTALSGANDWADTEPDSAAVRRAGLVHGMSNTVALSLYTASLIARLRGARGRGVALGTLGWSVLAFSGYLGGHLTFARGVGPDQTVYDVGSDEWTPACDGAQLADGRLTRIVVGETPVLLHRDGELVFAIHDRCSHRGCSLSEGQLEGEEIVCACHGSRFDRRDGSLRGGPATSPQPAFQVRDNEGVIEVRHLSPGSG